MNTINNHPKFVNKSRMATTIPQFNITFSLNTLPSIIALTT